MPGTARARFRIGPSGWSYPDWAGVVYPLRRPAGFRPLRFIARLFNAVEVNSSFYRLPEARTTAAWPALVPPDFRFAFKLTRTFTHERGTFPSRHDFAAFAEGVRPVREAGLLGPLLIQFPWSFRFNAENADWLTRLAGQLAEFQRFVEVRHASWLTPEGLATVRRAGGWCNIDQPQLRDCLPPTAHTADRTAGGAPGAGRAAYVRLHGRNAQNWFAEGVPPFERYNYLYDDAELREWVARIESMAASADEVYVFANNHYRGQGVTNALELRAMLERRPVDVPAELSAAYPRLRAIAAAPREPGLFD